MGSGVGSYSTGGAKGVRGFADPLQKTVEGRAEPRTELGKGGAVGAGEGGFLLRYRRRRGLEDSVRGLGGDGTGHCICMEGFDGVFVLGVMDDAAHSVRGDIGKEA